jgi:hypothetical protein
MPRLSSNLIQFTDLSKAWPEIFAAQFQVVVAANRIVKD